jgi:hypothetical protein
MNNRRQDILYFICRILFRKMQILRNIKNHYLDYTIVYKNNARNAVHMIGRATILLNLQIMHQS